MDKKIIEFNKALRGDKKMDFQAGDVVKIHLRIKEGEKQRVQIFEGLILGIKGRQGSSPMITVRKVSHGVGVEMILPLLSKNIQKIDLIKRAKVRRAKLYYIRDLTAKQSRMKYKDIKEFIKKEDSAKVPEIEVVEDKIEKKEEVIKDKKEIIEKKEIAKKVVKEEKKSEDKK